MVNMRKGNCGKKGIRVKTKRRDYENTKRKLCTKKEGKLGKTNQIVLEKCEKQENVVRVSKKKANCGEKKKEIEETTKKKKMEVTRDDNESWKK